MLMCNRNFGTEIPPDIDRLYRNVVRPQHGGNSQGGCMLAVYNGAISALYGSEYAKGLLKDVQKQARKIERDKNLSEGSANDIDLVFETLRRDGKADAPWVFRFKQKTWICESPPEQAGRNVEDAIAHSVLGEPAGWYFFGVSVSGATHSVVFAVHHLKPGKEIFWLDQFSTGCQTPRRSSDFTPSAKVTGKVGAALLEVGEDPTKLWPLCAKGRVSMLRPNGQMLATGS
jgi:hypothetical protein